MNLTLFHVAPTTVLLDKDGKYTGWCFTADLKVMADGFYLATVPERNSFGFTGNKNKKVVKRVTFNTCQVV